VPASAKREGLTSVDVVIPIWNEEEALPLLIGRLNAVFAPQRLADSRIRSVRYLFIDDGSRDRSAEILGREIERGLPAVLYRFSRNFGHQSAVAAGIDHSVAEVVVIMDADLQDPPELIPAMVERWREGHDVVYGQRRRRKENLFKVLCYAAFYRLIALLSEINVPLDSGDFCLMDRRVVRAISALPERLRFPRGLRAWVGFRQTGIEYDRPRRQAGKSKYNFARLYRLATDGVASSSIRPLKLAQVFSVSYVLLAFLLGLLLLLQQSVATNLKIPPVVLLGYLLIVTGNLVQVLCIYILGAYVGRTYLEVKGRPPYVVMEVLGDPHHPPPPPKPDA
jgi:polyisoprenyl-phosphate glycosyltransferase